MTDKLDTIDAIEKVTDILLLSLILLQGITGKSREEVFKAIDEESRRTDELLSRLR